MKSYEKMFATFKSKQNTKRILKIRDVKRVDENRIPKLKFEADDITIPQEGDDDSKQVVDDIYCTANI